MGGIDAGRTIIDLLQSDLRIMRKAVLRLLREHKGFRLLRRRGWHRGTRVRIHGATRFAKESIDQHTGGKGQIDKRGE